MWKLVSLAGVSAIIVWVLWRSLRNRRARGFYRFFAFESILPLILLNLDRWFADPFSPLHIVAVAAVDSLTVSGDTRVLPAARDLTFTAIWLLEKRFWPASIEKR